MGTCMIPNCRKNTAWAEPFCSEHTDIEDRDPTYQKRYEAALLNWDVEVNDLRSKLEKMQKLATPSDFANERIKLLESRLDTNEQERVKLASWFNEAEQMAGKLQRERDLALRRLDSVRAILLDRFGTGEISPLVAVGLIGKELLLTPTRDDVLRAAAAVVETPVTIATDRTNTQQTCRHCGAPIPCGCWPTV